MYISRLGFSAPSGTAYAHTHTHPQFQLVISDVLRRFPAAENENEFALRETRFHTETVFLFAPDGLLRRSRRMRCFII